MDTIRSIVNWVVPGKGEEHAEERPYKPSVRDVFDVKVFLSRLMENAPLEIIDMVIDAAEYWPYVATTYSVGAPALGNRNAYGQQISRGSSLEDVLVLRSPPICTSATLLDHLRATSLTMDGRAGSRMPDETPNRSLQSELELLKAARNSRSRDELNQLLQKLEQGQYGEMPQVGLFHPVRKIVWTIQSHDQGWSGEAQHTRGTYQASWTWFSAGIERLHEIVPTTEAETNLHIRAVPSEDRTSVNLLRGYPEQHRSTAEWFKRAPAVILPERPSVDRKQDFAPSLDQEAIASLDQHSTPNLGQESTPNLDHGSAPSLDQDSLIFYDATDSEFLTGAYTLQRNVQSKRENTRHVITWHYLDDQDGDDPLVQTTLNEMGRGACTQNGKFVRSLERGDCVTLWAHARFPGWVNHVGLATVEVYFKM